MEKYLNQPKLDISICNFCPHSNSCELTDPNEGQCKRYEDYLIYCEYQAEGER